MIPAHRLSRPFAIVLGLAIGVAVVGCSAEKKKDGPTRTTGLSASPSATPPPPLPPSPTPSPTISPSASPKPPPAASPTARPKPAAWRYAFPVLPLSRVRFGRAHHNYPATDIFAGCGDTFRAATTGRVIGVERVDRWLASVNAGATRGGLSVTLLGDDGVRYYGSHLRSVDSTVTVGRRVGAGRSLGRVGNTGSARGTACHVHFGISPPCGTADWYNRRGLLYPWPYLESWRDNGQRSPAAAVASYRKTRGCPSGPLTYP